MPLEGVSESLTGHPNLGKIGQNAHSYHEVCTFRAQENLPREETLKILYTVITYKRPKMLRNAIRSVYNEGLLLFGWLHRTGHQIEIVIIDDCEAEAIKELGARRSGEYDGMRIIQPGDTLTQKKGHTASRVGWALNQAVQESDADLVMMLCDDDLVYPGAVKKIITFFEEHPDEDWGWGSACSYDANSCDFPFIHTTEGVQLIDGEVVNAEGINVPPGRRDVPCMARTVAANRLDISQVVWRRQSQIKHNIRWTDKSHPKNEPIDHMVFHQMDGRFQEQCPNMDILVQYKGSHDAQISHIGVNP